mgnify:CR=1 FL=1|tara:strand:+ start:689 stop:2482 length:1794 start_codon:yes stop_codon:yes gene_type:complete
MKNSKIPEIFIPCCDASLFVVKINSYLFNKFWPEAKVNFLGFSPPDYEFYNENHTFYSLAPEQVGGAKSWTRYIHRFMKEIKDEFVIFSLDDFLVCMEPNIKMVEAAFELMKRNSRVGRFDLTFDSQIEPGCTPIGKLNGYNIIQKHPRAPYRISTQPSIWNKDFLLTFLDNDWSPWDFEIGGTEKSITEDLPQQTLAFYDKNLVDYPLRTTAKGAISRFNPNKYNVLGIPMEVIKELAQEGFFKEDDLIWGQHADNPPGFYEKEGYNFHPSFLDYHPTSKTRFEEYHCVYDDPKSPLLTVNLWDFNFVHTKDHPDFGYITTQGEKTPRGKKIRYLEGKKDFREYSGITIFTDRLMSPEIIKSVNSPIKIGWIMEPPVVHQWAFDALPNVIDELDYVFSFSKELADKYEKCHLFPFCYIRVARDDWRVYEKTKMVSLIASDKKWAPGHILRHKVADKLANKHNIDLWGGGFKSFPPLGKIDALKDHMFSIVIQNCQLDTFFTDFVDPLITGTIPIFWGTRQVCEYFDKDGIIFFDTFEELDEILTNLTEDDYYKRLSAVKKNFEIAKTYWRADDQLADLIYRVVDFDKLNPNFRTVK